MKPGDKVTIRDYSWVVSVHRGSLSHKRPNTVDDHGKEYTVVETGCRFPLIQGYTPQPERSRSDTLIESEKGMVVLTCSKFLSVVKVTLPIIEKPKQEKKMRKLTLNETWDYTKRMWYWVAVRKEVYKDERSVEKLKKVWLGENAPEFRDITSGCFFCDAQSGACVECPGKLVDRTFICNNPDYYYRNKPGAFYREILRLDAIRTAAPPEHVWEHGDVFKTSWGSVMIYIVLDAKNLVYCILGTHDRLEEYSHPSTAAPNTQYCLADATFLFNIKDALTDRGLV